MHCTRVTAAQARGFLNLQVSKPRQLHGGLRPCLVGAPNEESFNERRPLHLSELAATSCQYSLLIFNSMPLIN
jgi:hypothetical protein